MKKTYLIIVHPMNILQKDKLLTLNDCKTYETFIKNKLLDMYNDKKYAERFKIYLIVLL